MENGKFTLDSAWSSPAKTLVVPNDHIVTIEHPCIVKDVDRGVQALGGEHHIKKILSEDNAVAHLSTSLRPLDPYARKVLSQRADVNHVLLRVILPKRTGRKRKRGSDDPFEYPTSNFKRYSAGQIADQILQQLKQAGNGIDVEPVGAIRSSHRFRSLPDFQLLDQDSYVMRDVARNLLDPSRKSPLEKIKAFRPDMSDRTPLEIMVGPPQFTSYDQQLYYLYAQNRGTATFTDAEGRVVSVNSMIPIRRLKIGLPATEPVVPTQRPSGLPELSDSTESLRDAVAKLDDLLKDRPVITRRAAMNICGINSSQLLNNAIQYSGYTFRSGPWKDTLCRFGIDPRTSPDYRIYQTLSFQLPPRQPDPVKTAATGGKWKRPHQLARDTSDDESPESHIFSGASMNTRNRTWQIIDITDPLLVRIITAALPRAEPDLETYGWYPAETMGVVRAIMRDKIGVLLPGARHVDDGDEASRSTVYERVASAVSEQDITQSSFALDTADLDARQKRTANRLLAHVRSVMRADTGKGKKDASKGMQDEGEDEDEDDAAVADLEALEHADVAGDDSGAEAD
ncbi:hypothetical protein ANO11243_018690 [Dothideomycetidae sp. 11243]|nr:hypothetical protein ANO11243_018690 [fungal sp. No.11243]